MLTISRLPKFKILRDGGREELDLSRCGGKIQWLSDRIEQKFPTQKRLGIVSPTSPQLILLWLAALKANKEPCILQYPTEKLAQNYWRDSVAHTIKTIELEGLIHGPELAPYHPKDLAPCFMVDSKIRETALRNDVISEGAVIQLSSGTTGYKKGIRLTLNQLGDHVDNYNKRMFLNSGDTIVTWLPLYHDMGFIACFVMPLLLGIPVVMMDPMIWVKKPDLLFTAITENLGTICYLPNFGFEVMSRFTPSRSLSTMRHWISCSEPTHIETLDRFCQRTGTDPKIVSTCYGMAENVFAVTQSDGLKPIEFEGKSMVSCGRPIPGTDIKIVDGEIFVRSGTSLDAYIGTEDIRDPEGFYATGDLGTLADGELIVSGRKRDLMICAGKKYLLSDLDHTLGKILPESAARIASLADHNKSLGTETVIFLVERPKFWEAPDLPVVSKTIKQATGLDTFEIHFVPSGFITKTSSGKINRVKTLADWKLCRQDESRSDKNPTSDHQRATRLAQKIAETFPTLPKDTPIGGVLDSLGEVLMRLICEDQGITYDPKTSLNNLLARTNKPEAVEKVFSIVALVDGIKLGYGAKAGFLDPAFLQRLAQEVGAPVNVEHVCAPPVSILLSDMIFHDYFMPRDAGEKYAPFSALIGKIKNASLVLIDDEDAFRLRDFCAYPRLSHRFENAPEADLLGHRLQPYTRNHHLLAREVVLGKEIPLKSITETIGLLSAYLQTPIMKLAFHQQFQAFTHTWDHCQYRSYISDADYQANPIDCSATQAAILDFVEKHRPQMRYAQGLPNQPLLLTPSCHFCSFLLRREAVDYVTSRYSSFCIAGMPSSLPYVATRLKELGKPFFYATTVNPARTDFECLIITGFGGDVNGNKPYFDFVHVGAEGGKPHNVSSDVALNCPELAAGNPELIQDYRKILKNLTIVGNFVLNLEVQIRAEITRAAHHSFARGLIHQKRFIEAVTTLKQCLAIPNPDSHEIVGLVGSRGGLYHDLAVCMVELKDFNGACKAFHSALAEDPLSPSLRLDYGKFLVNQKKPVEGLQLFYKLIEENSANLDAWLVGGRTLLNNPEFLETAASWTTGAIQLHPNNPYILSQRAEALTLAQGYLEAVPLWRRLAPATQPSMLAALLICEVLAGVPISNVPSNLEEAVSREFIDWRQRFLKHGLASAIAKLDQHLYDFEAIIPTAASLLGCTHSASFTANMRHL